MRTARHETGRIDAGRRSRSSTGGSGAFVHPTPTDPAVGVGFPESQAQADLSGVRTIDDVGARPSCGSRACGEAIDQIQYGSEEGLGSFRRLPERRQQCSDFLARTGKIGIEIARDLGP